MGAALSRDPCPGALADRRKAMEESVRLRGCRTQPRARSLPRSQDGPGRPGDVRFFQRLCAAPCSPVLRLPVRQPQPKAQEQYPLRPLSHGHRLLPLTTPTRSDPRVAGGEPRRHDLEEEARRLDVIVRNVSRRPGDSQCGERPRNGLPRKCQCVAKQNGPARVVALC